MYEEMKLVSLMENVLLNLQWKMLTLTDKSRCVMVGHFQTTAIFSESKEIVPHTVMDDKKHHFDGVGVAKMWSDPFNRTFYKNTHSKV